MSGLALVGADRGRAPVEPAEALVAAVASGSSQRSLEETAGLAGSALSLEPEPAVISGVGGADPLSDEELDLLVQDLFTRPREVLAALAREPVERVLAALGARPECAEYVDHESLRRLHERALGVPPDAQAAFFLTLIEQQAGREWGRLEKGLIFAMATVPDWQGWKKIRLDLALSRDRVDLALPLAPNYSDWKHLPTDLAMLGAETVGRTEQGPFAQGGWQGLVARHPYARVQIVHYELREPKPTGPDELTERWRAKQAEVRARAWAAAERLLAHPQLTARGFGLALETLLDVYRSSEPGEDWRQPERWDELERLAGQARRRFGLADSRIAVARQRLAWLRFQDSPGSSEWAELERSMVAVRQLSRAPRAWLLQLEASLHRLSLLRTRRAAGRGRDLLGFVQLGFRRVEPFASIEQPFGWSRGQVRQLAVLRGWLALHEDRGAELAFEGLRQGAWSHYWQHGGLGRDARSILGPRPAERLKRRLVEARGRPARGR